MRNGARNPRRIFVAGSSDLLVEEISRSLLAGGDIVTSCLINGKEFRVTGYGTGSEQIRSFSGWERLALTMSESELVVNCPDIVSPQRSGEFARTNVWDETRSVLAAAVRAGVGRFVQIGTVDVVGKSDLRFADENVRHGFFPSAFERYARKAENAVLDAHDLGLVSATILRTPYVYGGRNDFVAAIVGAVKNDSFCFVGSPVNEFEVLYVGNLVEAVQRAIENPFSDELIYNVTDGRPVSRNFIATLIAGELGRCVGRKTAGVTAARIKSFFGAGGSFLNSFTFGLMKRKITLATNRAGRDIGYFPAYTTEEGIRRSVCRLLGKKIDEGRMALLSAA